MQSLHGPLAIFSAVFAFSLSDAIIKAHTASLPLWQILVLRSAVLLPILWVAAKMSGRALPLSLSWVTLRSILLAAMWLSYYVSLTLMPLPIAVAAYYTAPLFIVAFFHLLQRRRPKPQIVLAAFLGFAGVATALGPRVAEVGAVTLLPVAAAVFYAFAAVMTSTVCRKEDPIVLVYVLNIALVVFGFGAGAFANQEGSPVFGAWQQLDLQALIVIAGLSFLMLVGTMCAAIAYQRGQPSVIATLDYTYLAFGLFWSAVFFAEFPSDSGIVGIVLIGIAGLIAVLTPASRSAPA